MNVYFVVFLQMLLASGTHIVAKSVTKDFDAAVLTLLRSILASAGFLLLLRVRRSSLRVERDDLVRLAIAGICGTANQWLYLYGLRFTTAANGALLYGTTPVFVLILSRLFLGERITFRKTAGILLAFTGVTIVIFERGIDLSSDYTFGNLIILAAVVLWALFTILGKPLVLRYGAVKSTGLTSMIGMLFMIPWAAGGAGRTDLSAVPPLDWAGVVYLGIGTSIVGYLLWYYALGRIEASKLAVFANGQPIIASLLAVLFLDFHITMMFVLGGLVTMAGVVLTQFSREGTS